MAGPAGILAFLEDYADAAEGFLALVSATGDPVWLSFAEQVLDVVLARFAARTGLLRHGRRPDRPASGGGSGARATRPTTRRRRAVRRCRSSG